ncbi:MAG: FAD-dependent monooxygenase [Alphaproteobacteria bacterium]|nr:FAD-dependent monooxygenase [Alphaproteobacteria bacterium]
MAPIEEAEEQKIIVYGDGSTARLTALALTAARLPVLWTKPKAAKAEKADTRQPPDWQSVLALSPSAKTMLETLGVWQALDRPAAPICDMAVYGNSAAFASDLGLEFADPPTPQDATTKDDVSVLAHIVCRAALARALISSTDDAISKTGAAANLSAADSALIDFDTATGDAHFADGQTMRAALLVDCTANGQDGAPAWRHRAAGKPLVHDYQASALVATLRSDKPHGNKAVQLFLPDGPLALLPLPDAHQRALIWSLPNARAHALASCTAEIFNHELTQALNGDAQIGATSLATERAVQPLALKLAEQYVDGKLCLLGEAAHIIHPLAGQGFNLSMRDAAQLADCLFAARGLGLAYDAPGALGDYQALRRTDSGAMAATTHILAQVFSAPSPARPIARLGLALTARLTANAPRLAHRFRSQANRGTSDLPRLMRGHGF